MPPLMSPQQAGLPGVSSSLASAGDTLAAGAKQTWQTLRRMLPPWVSARVGGDDPAGLSPPKAGPLDGGGGGSDVAPPSSGLFGVAGGPAAGSEPMVTSGGGADDVGSPAVTGGTATGGLVEGVDKVAEPLTK